MSIRILEHKVKRKVKSKGDKRKNKRPKEIREVEGMEGARRTSLCGLYKGSVYRSWGWYVVCGGPSFSNLYTL
jgi:hypothetical protein